MDRERRRLLISERRFAEAIDLQERAILLAPDDANLHRELAWLLAASGRLQEAAEEQRKVVSIQPSNAGHVHALAAYLDSAGDTEGAGATRKLAAQIAAESSESFWRAQEAEKRAVREHTESLVRTSERHLAFGRVAYLDRADRLLRDHVIDSIGGWFEEIPVRYSAGEVATIAHIGQFYVNNPDHVLERRLARGMAWELPIAALLSELAFRCAPDCAIVEVGANIGVHAVACGVQHRGRVIAYEPLTSNLAALESNLELNGVSNVSPVRKACSDLVGLGGMHRGPSQNPGQAHLAPEGDLPSAGETVEVTTLDEERQALDQMIALIRIDAEGHEERVLHGAARTLAADRPIVIVELTPESIPGVEALLTSLRYAGTKLFRSDWIFFPES